MMMISSKMASLTLQCNQIASIAIEIIFAISFAVGAILLVFTTCLE